MRIKYSGALIAILLSTIFTAAEAREVVDTMGRNVDIPDQPERVVVMSEPAIAVSVGQMTAPIRLAQILLISCSDRTRKNLKA